MTREEFAKKEVIRIADIQETYGVCYHTAGNILRAIKAYSDRLGIRGICHQLDYQDYINAKSKYEESKK